MGNQEVFTRPSTMLDDERLGALNQAGKGRSAFRQHDICGGVFSLILENVGHGSAGANMQIIPEIAAPCGTLGCTDTRPAVYLESERLYYCTSGAE